MGKFTSGWIRAWVLEESNSPSPDPGAVLWPSCATTHKGCPILQLRYRCSHALGGLRRVSALPYASVNSQRCPWKGGEPRQLSLKGHHDSCAVDVFHRTLRIVLKMENFQLNFNYSQKRRRKDFSGF